MRKRNKSFLRKIIKLLILLIILFFAFSLAKKYFKTDIKNIGQAQNKNYSGIGQEKVKGKDGYDTIFITDSSKEYKEYKQGGNSSWSNKEYWGGTMEENGCGITSISIITSGYKNEFTPDDLRKKYMPHLVGENIPKELNNTFGIKCSDFYYSTVYFSKKAIIEQLEKDRPILICVWNKPDARWTEKSHYMVLLATDGENKIYVSNPNGEENESPSGWYDTERVLPYIAKALFIEE
mgnify:CR=1 FL=1